MSSFPGPEHSAVVERLIQEKAERRRLAAEDQKLDAEWVDWVAVQESLDAEEVPFIDYREWEHRRDTKWAEEDRNDADRARIFHEDFMDPDSRYTEDPYDELSYEEQMGYHSDQQSLLLHRGARIHKQEDERLERRRNHNSDMRKFYRRLAELEKEMDEVKKNMHHRLLLEGLL